jgi:hypothetical protein
VILAASVPTGGVATATMDGTGLMFEESATLSNYADGNSPSWAWSGAPNNSSSTGPPQ